MNVEDCHTIAELVQSYPVTSDMPHPAEDSLSRYIQKYEDHGVGMVVHHAMKRGVTTYVKMLQLLFRSSWVSLRARRDVIYAGFHRDDSGVQKAAIEMFKSIGPLGRREFLESHPQEGSFEDLVDMDILMAPSEVVELVYSEMPNWIGFMRGE